ncbi:MAG: plasmid replication protein RepC, partial [Pseudolabrys sp.]
MQMLDLIPTAPFGSRRLSVIALKAQRAVRNCPAGTSTHKWKTFRHICEAKVALGLSDRALGILNALLSFHPETNLVSGGRNLVVFPSNRELALRANGLAASTLRRHLALLVDTGLIVRRDSPNGKRYARKTAAGEIERAFGLDLSPLVVRAKELAGLAAAITRDRHAAAMLREQITVARRDVAKMIAMGIEQGVEADWPQLHQAFRQLLDRRAGQQSLQTLEELGAELTTMADHIRTILESQLQVVDPVETSTRDDRSPCKD